ncbi:MAG: pyridoxamine 5'-phosphate oxidase family protein [Chitinophagales bacterium]|nr:pyridoxamine 5'-phosphate oxidase family protein [Chitinophagales bacterium]
MKNSKTTVKRIAARGHYDKETIYAVLDAACICHLAFVYEGYPVVIPTIYGREDDYIYFHGSSASRMLKTVDDDISISLSVAMVDGIVLARSGFHSSLNYRSVVAFGVAEKVVDTSEKENALKQITEHIIKDRWEEIRPINEKELQITDVFKLKLDEVSAKIRTGEPKDELADYKLNIWSGVIPMKTTYMEPESDSHSKDLPVSKAALRLTERKNK